MIYQNLQEAIEQISALASARPCAEFLRVVNIHAEPDREGDAFVDRALCAFGVI